MTITLPFPIPKDPKYIYPIKDLELAKPLISTTITHPALIIPSKSTATLRNALKNVLMNRPKLKGIYELLPSDSHSDPSIDPKSERKIVLTNNDKEYPHDNIYSHPSVKQLLDNANTNTNDHEHAHAHAHPDYATIRKSTHNVILGYDHFTVEEILSKILPREELSEIPTSFEVIGHLAHITLREEYHPYKYIIGRTILDKNKGIHVVVNKTGTIQNEFRTFPMEILADDRKTSGSGNGNGNGNGMHKGEGSDLNLVVEVKEDGCRFQLDFEKVYWNSRLQFEHKRIVHVISGKERPTNVKRREIIKNQSDRDGVRDGDRQKAAIQKSDKIVVADACAGIGPFAIPLTSQYDNVEVYANDLNPESYKYLESNAKLNKCHRKGHLHTYNMDGRYFLRKLDDEGIKYDHVLMNLPAIAPEFLNVFRGWKGDYDRRPMIHVHCFAAKIGGDQEAVARCGRSLGCQLDLEKDEVHVHEVRNVSPKKNMYCVSFRLPEGVKDVEQVQVFGDVVTGTDDEQAEGKEEPATKKPRTS